MGDNEEVISADKFELNRTGVERDERGLKSSGRRSSSTCQSAASSNSSSSLSPKSVSSSVEKASVVEEKNVLLQHHHDLSNLCRDLEQHKLDMQRQHLQLAEALRNPGATSASGEATEGGTSRGNHEQESCHQEEHQRREKLRTRKEGRDEHGMNGVFTFASNSTNNIPTASSSNSQSSSGNGKRDNNIWDEEITKESVHEEGMVAEIPELINLKSTVYSSGLPPRTIPFRSASFSQVDITSEGKYVRNPRSPITLKPTAFCYLNKSYASGSSTLPRTHGSTAKQHRQLISCNSSDDNCGSGGEAATEQDRCLIASQMNHHDTIMEQIDPNFSDTELALTELENTFTDTDFIDNTKASPLYLPPIPHHHRHLASAAKVESEQVHGTESKQSSNMEESVDKVAFSSCENGNNLSKESLHSSPPLSKLEVGDVVPITVDSSTKELNLEQDPLPYCQCQSPTLASYPPVPESNECKLESDDSFEKFSSCDVESGMMGESVKESELSGSASNKSALSTFSSTPTITGTKHNKPQLMRSPPLIREESIMARSSSEEGANTDQENIIPCCNALPPINVNESSPVAKHKKKHVLLDLDIGGCGGDKHASSISGSGGEDDAEKDKHGLYRQSSGQSDESGDCDRQSDGCTSPPISSINTSLQLHRPLLSTKNSPLTDALALDSTMRHGSCSASNSSEAPTAARSASNLHSTSLPQTSSSNQSYFKSSNDNENLVDQRDNDRMNSLSSPNVNRQNQPRRYNTRPLRGPYGEMLEAEMKKLVPSRSREYDTSEFFGLRESKSSSPNRSQAESDNSDRSTPQQVKLLTSSFLMSSMDDLNLTKQRHSNTRSRKISANLPVSHYQTREDGTPIAFHQRTASSPSQLLFAASSSSSSDLHTTVEPQRGQLDSSPRGHVLAEIVETEKSYVDSLRIIVKKYMEPLKASDILDNALVDEIFFQVPPILRHHEQLLDDLQRTVTDDNQCVGNVFLDTFQQPTLLECYSLFVKNWNNAKSSLKLAITSRPQLGRFLEAQARQHRGKLTVDSLLIMPIQRIPRYELLLKELLKHTEPTHEDHPRVKIALEKIKKFAIYINCASVDLNGTKDFDIEGWSYGLGHLVRQDIVTLCNSQNGKKERALFLFADSLVIASIKRKGTMRRIPQPPNPANNFEGCKFKLLMKVHLTDVHISGEEIEGCCVSKGGSSSSATGSCGGALVSSSSHSEEPDDLKTINKMMELANLLKCPHVGLDEVLRELASGLRHHGDNADILEIEIRTSDGSDTPEALKVIFGSSDRKISWVEAFQETLTKFTRYGFGKLPQVQFIQALPIRKTRAGLQLSCAAPVTLVNKGNKSMEMTDLWVANSDGYVGQICILTLHPEPAITSCNGVCNSRITCIISVPPASYFPFGPAAYHAESFAGTHDIASHSHPNFHSLGYESEDDHRLKAAHKAASSEHWSVWLGTEDGSLHVYDCSDSVRVKKNRHKVQHKAPMHSMIFFDKRVFVALGNGDVAVYNRNASGKGWMVNDPSWVTIGSAMNPVTKMICVHSYIWCACGSQIKVYGENGGMLELIQTIQIVIDGNQMPRGLSAMVSGDQQVWVAVQQSSIIKSYSTSTFECLSEINVTPDVTKILAGCDDIIRQHKSACLRVTALLSAPDKSLWIGTSAGVLLTISSTGQNPKISPLCHGHTGQVRFLTCCVNRDSWTVISGGDGYEEFRGVAPLAGISAASFSGVVAGTGSGDAAGDLSGREDSTNHLLIWKVARIN